MYICMYVLKTLPDMQAGLLTAKELPDRHPENCWGHVGDMLENLETCP
jgi:hypothetical protein